MTSKLHDCYYIMDSMFQHLLTIMLIKYEYIELNTKLSNIQLVQKFLSNIKNIQHRNELHFKNNDHSLYKICGQL